MIKSTADSKISLLFTDEYFRVFHKPENITFHSEDGHVGLVSRIKALFPDEVLYPVHRLDRMTSGLMVFARSPEANSALSNRFGNKQVEKYYLAVASSKPNKKQGTIAGDMAKSRAGSYKLLRSKNNAAVTRFFTSPISDAKHPLWLFLLKPETGKTHQLRVAMKSLGSPVLGDTRYKGGVSDRGYLHAYRIRFDVFGRRYEISDPNFNGHLSMSVSQTLESNGWQQPESLHWPKTAFLLTR